MKRELHAVGPDFREKGKIYLTVDEMAEMILVRPNYIRRLLRRGEIKSISENLSNGGFRYLVDKDEFMRFVESKPDLLETYHEEIMKPYFED